MIINKVFLTCFFLLLAVVVTTAQVEEKKPLKSVLSILEQRYGIVFSYADDQINDLWIEVPEPDLSLSQALQHLTEKAGLQFVKINERFVSIRRDTNRTTKVCGSLVASDTGERIVGATIRTGNYFLQSDSQGEFVLNTTVDDSVIHIQFLGYRPARVLVEDLTGEHCKTIFLPPELIMLQEITVTNFIAEGIEKRTDGSLSIRSETLGMLPGLTDPDVLQTVQALPGIKSVSESISDINVRGGTSDQNLILWDGIKMYQLGHFFGLISAINPYLTKSVTFIQNGTTSALGDGVSSTMQIFNDDQLATHFSGGAGINLLNGDAYLHIPLSKKLSLQVSGRRSISDLVLTPTYKSYFERAFKGTDVTNSTGDTIASSDENFYFYDATLKFLYDVSAKDKVRFSLFNANNNLTYQENASVNGQVASKQSGLQQKSFLSGISYSRLWSNRLKTSVQTYLSYYDLHATNHDIPINQRLVQDNQVMDIGIKLDTRFNVSDVIGLYSGYQFYEVGVTNLDEINNPGFRREIKNVLRIHAGFVEADYNSRNNKTNIRAGLRTNYFGKLDKLIFEPRLVFNQKLTEHIMLEVLGEFKSQATVLAIDLQSDFLGVEKRRWILANNTDTPLLRSKQVSTGIHLQKNNWLINVQGYYKTVKGILTSSQGFQNQFQHVRSSGEYHVAGVDVLVTKKIRQFTTWSNYTFAKNLYTFNQLIPSTFPNNLDIRHAGTLGVSYTVNQFDFSLGVNWRTGRPFTSPVPGDEVVSNNINYGPPNGSRLENYLRMDCSLRYRFTLGRNVNASMAVSLWNILDRVNVLNKYYYLDGNDVQSAEQQALRFTPNIVIRVKF